MHVHLPFRRAVLPLVLALAGGCASGPSRLPDPPARAEAVSDHPVAARYRAGIEAFNAHDLEAFLGQFAEDVDMYAHQGWLRGGGAVRARFTELFQRFPKLRMEVRRLQVRELTPQTAVVDFVAATYPMGGGPAYHTVGSGVYVLRAGRWVEVLEHETTTHADAPLPLPPPAREPN